MRVKVDEDLPPAVVQGLREAGHDAVGVVEQAMSGWKDPDLWQAVLREGCFLVTSDKGFGDIRVYPPGTHAGVLVLRPDQDGIRPLVELTELVLARTRVEDLARLVSVVSRAACARAGRHRCSPPVPSRPPAPL